MALALIQTFNPAGPMVRRNLFTISGVVTGSDGNPAARRVMAIDPSSMTVVAHTVSSAVDGTYELVLAGLKDTDKFEVVAVGEGEEYSAILGRM